MKYYIHQSFWKFRRNNLIGKIYRAPRGKHMRQNLANGKMVNAEVWTDYPLNKNDLLSGQAYDEPRTEVPMRKVEFLGWDYNKYCIIKYHNSYFEIKLYYCHQHNVGNSWWKNINRMSNAFNKMRFDFPELDRDDLQRYLNKMADV